MTRKPIKMPGVAKPKKPVTPRVARTVNAQTETLSQHMGKIRSALRAITRFGWKPISQVRKEAQRKVRVNGRLVIHYECSVCGSITPKIQIDHVVGAGSLKSYADLPLFCQRLFCEDVNSLRPVCVPCHKKITGEKSLGSSE